MIGQPAWKGTASHLEEACDIFGGQGREMLPQPGLLGEKEQGRLSDGNRLDEHC